MIHDAKNGKSVMFLLEKCYHQFTIVAKAEFCQDVSTGKKTHTYKYRNNTRENRCTDSDRRTRNINTATEEITFTLEALCIYSDITGDSVDHGLLIVFVYH